MNIISIINRKGGVGKTTTAYNLAFAFSELDKKVLLVDSDSQGHTTKAYGITDDNVTTLYDCIVDKKPLQNIVKTIKENLDILPSNENLKILESYLNGKLKEFHKLLKNNNQYDICLFDCSPSDSNINDNVLCTSDYVIVPCECQYFSKDGIVSIVNKIESVKEDYNTKLDILGFLITKYNDSFNHHQVIEKEIRDRLQDKVFKTKIRQDVKLSVAPEYAQSIFSYSRDSKASNDYVDLVKEIISKI